MEKHRSVKEPKKPLPEKRLIQRVKNKTKTINYES